MARKIAKSKSRRKNPINYREGERYISFSMLFNGIDSKLADILIYGIYGRYYQERDIATHRDHILMKDLIKRFESHIREYLPILTPKQIGAYRFLISEMKKLADIPVILPQEFGENVMSLDRVYNEYTVRAGKEREKAYALRGHITGKFDDLLRPRKTYR